MTRNWRLGQSSLMWKIPFCGSLQGGAHEGVVLSAGIPHVSAATSAWVSQPKVASAQARASAKLLA